jgi:hypothetical protein
MLKPLLLASTATIFQLVLVSTNTLGIAPTATANTFTASHQQEAVSSTESLSTLISKSDKSAHINSQQQSDVKGIHRTLTQFYRGLNEYDVDRMARVAMPASEQEKSFLRTQFSKFRSARVRVSVEVKNIELLSLSDRQATVNIEQFITTRAPQGLYTNTYTASVVLVKDRGQWKVGGSGAAMQSLDRGRK